MGHAVNVCGSLCRQKKGEVQSTVGKTAVTGKGHRLCCFRRLSGSLRSHLKGKLFLRRHPLCHVIALVQAPWLCPGTFQVKEPVQHERRREGQHSNCGLHRVVLEPPLFDEICAARI